MGRVVGLRFREVRREFELSPEKKAKPISEDEDERFRRLNES